MCTPRLTVWSVRASANVDSGAEIAVSGAEPHRPRRHELQHVRIFGAILTFITSTTNLFTAIPNKT